MKNRGYVLLYLAAALLGLLLAVYFGSCKRGFYIDEDYTYTLANGNQLGISIDNGSWQGTEGVMDQLASDESENFRLSQVYAATSNNVHPPLYYYLIHLSSSFYTGRFSKWTGLIVNILLWIPCLVLAGLISAELSGGKKKLAFAAFLVYCISPAILSGLMLIRMYVPLHLFTMLYAYIILRDMHRDRLSVKGFLLPIFITGFLGFMTQYYFVIIMFFFTLFYFLFMVYDGWKDRAFKRPAAFAVTALLSLVATYFYWPVSIYHIFKGYRGADSFKSLISSTNTGSRIALFFGNLNDNVYGGLLIFAVLTAAAGIWFMVKKGRPGLASLRERAVLVMGLSAGCYFLVITKIGLRASYASNRYVFPVYGIFIILSVIGLYEALMRIVSRSLAAILTGAIIVTGLLVAYMSGQVLFLYTEEEQLDSFVAAHPDAELLVFNNDDGKYDTRIKDYIYRDRVYWARCDHPEDLNDPEIAAAKELLVYTDGDSNFAESIMNLMDAAPDLNHMTYVFTTPGGDFEVWYLDSGENPEQAP